MQALFEQYALMAAILMHPCAIETCCSYVVTAFM